MPCVISMLVYIDTSSAVKIFAPGGSFPSARRSASASYESLRIAAFGGPVVGYIQSRCALMY
eukprot:scaffold104578_cov67-Attheya_sp.AAC.4